MILTGFILIAILAMGNTHKFFTKQLMTKTNYFTVEFFHGGQKVWKPVGSETFTELEEAQAYKAAQIEMCGGVVDFRIQKF